MKESMIDQMPDLEKLRRIATDLRKRGGYWGTFPLGDLMGWLLHKGRCVYCDTPLVEPYHMTNGLGGTDHLLPQADYPELDDDPLNLLPVCVGCNGLKRDWDPNTQVSPQLYHSKTGEPVRDEHTCELLISRAREHVDKRRKERQANFPKDQANWSDALGQWSTPS